ncbi:MAG: hypothetical protein EOM87_09385, partial [Clostridia bacterium]|nr:hypothetical protein [Clostridia bacterium]
MNGRIPTAKNSNRKNANALTLACLFILVFFIVSILTFGVELVGVDSDTAASFNLSSETLTAEAATRNPPSGRNNNTVYTTGNLGSGIGLSSNLNYWGYQQLGGTNTYTLKNGSDGSTAAEVGIYSGGDGHTVAIFTYIELNADLIDLRQQGVLTASFGGTFGSITWADKGYFGIGTAGITDSNITSSSTKASLVGSIISGGISPGMWWWESDTDSTSGTLTASGDDAVDKYLYLFAIVDGNSGFNFYFKNMTVTLNFDANLSFSAKRYNASNSGLSGDVEHTASSAKVGRNTLSPTTNLGTTSASQTFSAYSDYYT